MNEAQITEVVENIFSEISGRKGFDLRGLDDEIQEEIKTEWFNIIVDGLNEANGAE